MLQREEIQVSQQAVNSESKEHNKCVGEEHPESLKVRETAGKLICISSILRRISASFPSRRGRISADCINSNDSPSCNSVSLMSSGKPLKLQFQC